MYKCKRCGREFESKHVTALCKDCKIGKCIICGKEFSRSGGLYTQECCSRVCSGKWKKQTGVSKQVSLKAQKTKLDRYGTLSSDIFREYVRECKFCGKEFHTTSPNKVYCDGPHYRPCPICGKPTKVTDLVSGFVPTCSEECRKEKTRRTNQEKYGVDSFFQSKEHHDKSKSTMQEKYGVDFYSQRYGFKEELASKMKEKYGDNPYTDSDFSKKKIQTNIEKYGVPYPMMNEDVKAKSKETFEREHGGIGWASEEINSRIKSTMMEKYGVENPMQSPELREKANNSNVYEQLKINR